MSDIEILQLTSQDYSLYNMANSSVLGSLETINWAFGAAERAYKYTAVYAAGISIETYDEHKHTDPYLVAGRYCFYVAEIAIAIALQAGATKTLAQKMAAKSLKEMGEIGFKEFGEIATKEFVEHLEKKLIKRTLLTTSFTNLTMATASAGASEWFRSVQKGENFSGWRMFDMAFAGAASSFLFSGVIRFSARNITNEFKLFLATQILDTIEAMGDIPNIMNMWMTAFLINWYLVPVLNL